jgi:hypothetical protein
MYQLPYGRSGRSQIYRLRLAMRDSTFRTFVPKPVDLNEWRVQHEVRKFLHSTRGHTAPEAVPGPRGFIPRDGLDAARGIVYGAIAGALMWLTIYLLWPGK